MKTQTISQKSKGVKVEKDRLGSAVVSLISGIFSTIFLFLSFSLGEAGVAFFFMSLLLSTVGFILGIRARKSPNGRGVAIAGITLTVVPLIIGIIGIILTTVMVLFLYI